MRKIVSEHWNMVRKNLETGKIEPCGQYPSRKVGLQYAPDVLDSYLKNYAKCEDIDKRDELIGDFVAAQGKKAIQYGDYMFFLAPNVFNVWGDVKNEPQIPELVNESNDDDFEMDSDKHHEHELLKYHGNEQSITIPSKVGFICDDAFMNNNALKYLVILGNVKGIGSYSFGACRNLTSVEMEDGVLKIHPCAFIQCGSLVFVRIADTVWSIGDSAFAECSKLTSITIPESVEEFGSGIFCDCKNLKTVYVSTESQMEKIFNGLDFPRDAQIVVMDTGDAYKCRISGGRLEIYKSGNYEEPEEVAESRSRRMGGHRINENQKITLTLKQLRELVNESSNDEFEIENECLVKYVGNDEDVVIPDGVDTICVDAFRNNHSVKSVSIPNSVSKISSHAFLGCKNLESVLIQDAVADIGMEAFKDCGHLESVDLGNGVRSIGSGAFDGCSSLTSVSIPSSVKSLGGNLFDGCSNLETIYVFDKKHKRELNKNSMTDAKIILR